MMQAAAQRWRDHKHPGSIEAWLARGMHGTGSPHFHSILNGTSNTANIKDALNPGFENAVKNCQS